MARYYFDVFDGSAVFRDDHGDAFGSLDEVADQAIGVLADVAWDKLQNRQGQDFAVVVRDDERDVYRAALIFRDSYPDPEAASGPQDVCPMVSVSDPADLILNVPGPVAAGRRQGVRPPIDPLSMPSVLIRRRAVPYGGRAP